MHYCTHVHLGVCFQLTRKKQINNNKSTNKHNLLVRETMNKQKLLATCISMSCLGITSTGVFAQETQDTAENELEVIQVTSQKRSQRLIDVPVSVQAISGEMLDNLGVQDFSELVTISPSLALQDNLTPWQKSIYIRGVGTTINAPTVESSVSTVLDGVVLARQGQFFTDLADIERIEVLRGPQSTLFGKNASAGVISIVTKKPNLVEAEGNIGFGVDEYGAVRVKGFYGAPINDELAYRITANYSDSGDSHLENLNIGGPSLDHSKGQLVRAKLLWEASSEVEVYFIADYYSGDGPGGVRVARYIGNDVALAASNAGASRDIDVNEESRHTNINGRNEGKSDEYGFSAHVNWDLGDKEFVSITAYRDWSIQNYIDIDSRGYAVPLVSSPGVGTPFLVADIQDDKTSDQFSQEFRLQSSAAGDFQYVLGAYIWHTGYTDDRQDVRSVCFGGIVYPLGTSCEGITPIVINTPVGTFVDPIQVTQSESAFEEVDTEYYALFGQFDYTMNENLTITGGLRVQEDKFSWEKTQLGVVDPTHVPAAGYEGSGSVSYTEVTGKAGAQYSLSRNTNIYGNFSHGYKGPGAQLISTFVEPLEPETVDAFEIGYKGRLLSNTLDLNVALFSQTFEDTQVSYFDVEQSAFLATNAGESRQRGVEIDSIFAATENLTLTANLTYLDAEFLEYEVECYLQDTNPDCADDFVKSIAGEVTPYSPELKAIVGGRYVTELPFGNLGGFVQINYLWQSETQYDANQNPLTIQDSYGVADLSLGVEELSGKYKVTLYVKNLTDQNHVTNLAAFQDAVGDEENIIQFVPKSADRYMGINVEFNF